MNAELANWARVYANTGFRVFPVHTIRNGVCFCGGSRSCVPGKHPVARFAPRSLIDATADCGLIEAWWSKMPDANR
jgi:putative DNA primase/helicase